MFSAVFQAIVIEQTRLKRHSRLIGPVELITLAPKVRAGAWDPEARDKLAIILLARETGNAKNKLGQT